MSLTATARSIPGTLRQEIVIDGQHRLITDQPALAREVVKRYADMPQAERLLLFAMTRLGVREEISEPEDDLRP